MISVAGRWQRAREQLRSGNRVLNDSLLMLATTVLMSLFGALFWAVAARTGDQRSVGLAASMVAAMVTFSYLSQLGLNHTLIKLLPHSPLKRRLIWQATGLVSLAGAFFGLGYVQVMAVVSPQIADVADQPAQYAAFVVMVSASGVNLLSDGVLLSVGALGRNLMINGLLMGFIKCALPFVMGDTGAFELVASVGTASVVAAALSIGVALRCVPPDEPRRGTGLRKAVSFATAGYVAGVANILPVMIMPVLVVERLGSEENAVYFICFQILSLLNAVAYKLNSSSYAHASRSPEEVHEVVRTTLRILVGAILTAALVVILLAPWLLMVFGAEYREEGTTALRLMALASIPLALENWYAMRLRLRSQLVAMVLLQCTVSVTMLATAWVVMPWGIEWTAAALAAGYLSGLPVAWTAIRRGGADRVDLFEHAR